jgi:hypothetical protein
MVKMLPEEVRGKAVETATRIVGEQMVDGLSDLYALGAAALALALVLAFCLPRRPQGVLESTVPAATEAAPQA